ncbi:transmembrane protein 128-like [Clytia hemisphaerica]|uniref:Transmembrane protein 128 n=1 Tax=Clytia hemisphaerica TaxID=252671 RepID=A0A7M5WLK1_9CNID|eukprot:TCONS_00000930-protein
MTDSSAAFSESFLRFRERTFNQDTDDQLKKEGQKILDKHVPKKSGPINSHSVFWMVVSIFTFYYTDFYLALRYDPRIERTYLNIGLGFLSLSTLIAVTLIGYYHYYMGIKDYEKHQPFAIPISVVSFLVGMTLLSIALWPVWSFLTPIILFVLFMGFMFFFTIVPL